MAIHFSIWTLVNMAIAYFVTKFVLDHTNNLGLSQTMANIIVGMSVIGTGALNTFR